jgi:glycosyltransferase involved in cell wall biosynthesis
LADLIVRHDCGWVVEPGDAAGLRQALERIAADRGGLLAKRRNSFAAGHLFYDMAPVAGAWMRLFAELAGSET